MAISEMQKVRMVVHKTVADDVMSRIQKLGCCHFITNGLEKPVDADVAALRAKMRDVDSMLAEAKFAARFLEPFAEGIKGKGADTFTMDALERAASKESYEPTSEKLHDLDKRLGATRTELSRIAALIAQIEPLAGVPCSLDFYTSGSDLMLGTVCSAPQQNIGPLKDAVAAKCGDMAEVTVIPQASKDAQSLVSIIYPREKAAELQEALSHVQTTRVEIPSGVSGAPTEALEKLKGELAALTKTEGEILAEAESEAKGAIGATHALSDYWSIEKRKLETLIGGEQTEQISIYSFWIPKGRVAELKSAIAQYDDLLDIAIHDPQKGELPPTLLQNAGLSGPVEPLIEMYGTPTYGAFDPTAIVAPFFYMFFGICFGDAGYGLLIAALLIFVTIKKDLTGTARRFAMILILGNICALIFGALSFSWFGDSITAFGGLDKDGNIIEGATITFLRFLAPLKKLQILDPMNDPMTMLAVSLAFGFVHLMVGLLIAMYMNVKKRDYLSAFADQGGWIIFLVGLVLVGLTAGGMISFLPLNAAIGIAAAGAVILVATQGREKSNIFGKLFSGIMSLYGVTGYLGDVLSYSRLLALGLGSAAVGMVINLLANLVSGVPGVGLPLAVIVFIVGHLFGIAANILGAFVHSLRLQYVEFFGKFHEASGEEFHPLSLATQFVKISK